MIQFLYQRLASLFYLIFVVLNGNFGGRASNIRNVISYLEWNKVS